MRVWRGNNYLTISGIMGVKKGDETTEVITCKAMEHLKGMYSKSMRKTYVNWAYMEIAKAFF